MSFKTNPSDIFDEEDGRIAAALDIEAFDNASVYNHPGFKPVGDELSHVPLRVIHGKVPEDLLGVYLRNGTNPQFDKMNSRYHMFSGAGMLHQVQILDGEVTYSNHYNRTPRFLYEQAVGRDVFPSFGDMVAGPVGLQKMKHIEEKQRRGLIPNLSPLELTPASTAVQHHHGAVYALNESGYAFKLNAKTEHGRLFLDGSGELETWGSDWHGPFSAHPRFEPANQDIYNLSVTRSGEIVAGHIHEGEVVAQNVVHVQDEASGSMGFLHDFFITQNYLIFPDISFRSNEGFNQDYPLRWGVLPKAFGADTQVRWFETDQAGSIWHVINAWEQPAGNGGTEIVLYAPRFRSYPRDVPIHTPEEPPSYLNRWILNLESGSVSCDEQLLDHGYERPSQNLDFVGSESRYAYLIDEERGGYMGKGVLKYDLLENKEITYFDYGDFFGGEALFVSKENPKSEDDGYLLELLMTGTEAQFLILDAQSMEEVARLQLPRRVPFGVHACWLDQQAVEDLRTTA